MAGKIPPQFLPGYVKKSAGSAPKQAPGKMTPENATQKAENVTVLKQALKDNGVDPKKADAVVAQFKRQDR